METRHASLFFATNDASSRPLSAPSNANEQEKIQLSQPWIFLDTKKRPTLPVIMRWGLLSVDQIFPHAHNCTPG